jgi:hypothetical protein
MCPMCKKNKSQVTRCARCPSMVAHLCLECTPKFKGGYVWTYCSEECLAQLGQREPYILYRLGPKSLRVLVCRPEYLLENMEMVMASYLSRGIV